MKKLNLRSMILIVFGISILIVAGYWFFSYFKANKSLADSAADTSFIQINARTSAPIGVTKVGAGDGFMSWWQLSSANTIQGGIQNAILDSGGANSTWLKVVSVYPALNTKNANISYQICAANTQAKLAAAILNDPNSNLCHSYKFVLMNHDPWSLRFDPVDKPAVGRYAASRLIMTSYAIPMPMFPTIHSFEYQKGGYSGVVDISLDDIDFHSEYVEEVGSTLSEAKGMPPMAGAMEEMAAEFKSLTGKPFPLTSIYRSTKAQTYMHQHPEKYDSPASPCSSWHEAGLAADMKLAVDSPGGITRDEYENIVKALVTKYGFQIDNPNWDQSEDHHITYIDGYNYFAGDRAAAINEAVGKTVCPQ